MSSRVARNIRLDCTGPVTASKKHCGTINDIFLSCAVPLLADRYPQTMQFLVLRPLLHSGPHHIKYYDPFLSKLSRIPTRFKLSRGFSPRTVKTSGNGLTRLPYWFAFHQMLTFNVLRCSEVGKLHLNIQYKSRIGRSDKMTNHDKRWKQTISQIFAVNFTFDFTATASNFWWKCHGLLGGIIQGWFTSKGNLFIKPEEFRDHKCWKAFNTNIIILIVTDQIQNRRNEKRLTVKNDATGKRGQERPTKHNYNDSRAELHNFNAKQLKIDGNLAR